jgi:tryptophanyl-tRNA synthetase
MSKPVILTGLRANSELHIGNLLGAIKPIVDLQRMHSAKYQINMFVPDLHSFTTPVDHSNIYDQTIANLKIFVAAGLDINDQDTYLYRQSYIPAHSELAWILSCFTYYGELRRMTQFKEKSENLNSKSEELDTNVETTGEHVSAGLFNYPILMAADILLYGATYVPVGDDQRQHLELTRDLAIRFNNKFGNLFVVPLSWQKQLEISNLYYGVRIRSLRNPQKKMSKSVDDPAGTILLSDNIDTAVKKITGATTDNIGVINYDWDKQPGITNLLQLLALLDNKTQDEINSVWVNEKSYGSLKKTVAEKVATILTALSESIKKVDEDKLLKKLEQNEAHMNKVANDTLLKVQTSVGLRPHR